MVAIPGEMLIKASYSHHASTVEASTQIPVVSSASAESLTGAFAAAVALKVAKMEVFMPLVFIPQMISLVLPDTNSRSRPQANLPCS